MKTIGNLINLKTLDFGFNNLTGQIPIEIGNLTNLEILILSSNDLTGQIPVEIGNLTNLKSLIVNDNMLSGNIPSTIGNLRLATSVELNDNELSGNIPKELATVGANATFGGSFMGLINLRNNNLQGCFPIELKKFCTGDINLFIGGNLFLPASEDFFRFFPACTTEEGFCMSSETVNCETIQFSNENNQITVSGLTPQSKIEIIGRNTNWQIVPICDGDCSETQTIPDLMAGEYAVKVNLIGNDGSYCYREEKITVGGGNNNGGSADCNNLMFTGENGQITIDGLTATYNKVEIIGKNTDWQVVTICDGNCSDTQVIPDLMTGEYAVKINQSGSDGSYCYREEKITVGGGSNSGGSAD